jgi:hypothetical protein
MSKRKENAPAANGRSTANDGQTSSTEHHDAQAPVEFLMRQPSPKEVRTMLRHQLSWYPKVAEAALRRVAIESGQLTAKDLKRHGFKVNRDYAYLPQRENGQWVLECYEYYFNADKQGRLDLQVVAPGTQKPALRDIVIAGGCRDCEQVIRLRDDYIVRGETWCAAGMKEWASGYLHSHCLEARLGRALTAEDMLHWSLFSDDGEMMLWVIHPDYLRSPEFTQHGGLDHE